MLSTSLNRKHYDSQTSGEKTQLQERGKSLLTEIKGLASEIGRPVSTEQTEGKPADRISEFTTEQNADLVVIGRQGLTGAKRRLLGGVTEQVLHQSAIPVFVVPDGDSAMEAEADYSRILVPTDGSENAEESSSHGVAIAQNYGSEIHVLNVVDLQAAGGAFNAGGLEKEFVERLEARGQEAIDRVTNEINEADPDVAVQTAVERTKSFGGAAAGIREYVENNEIDLVVMGSHGRSNLKRQLLGSVASTVLRTVDIPVLVVKQSG